MNWTTLTYALLAAGAGCCIALQATANARFRVNINSALYAAVISIGGTVLTAALFLLIVRPPLPTVEALRDTQWWNWIGGPLGALIVLAGASLVGRLEAAAFIALVVAGQMACSIFLDHFGLLGLPENPITWQRVLGAVLVVAGVVCIKYL